MSILASTYNELAVKHTSSVISTNKSKASSSVSKSNEAGSISDELQLSPEMAFNGVIAEFKQSKASNLTINLSVKSNKPFSDSETQNKITNSADKLLKMVSRDEDEYKQLKDSFEVMFKEASELFQDEPGEDEVQSLKFNVQNNASFYMEQTEKEVKVSKGAMAGATIKYSTYKITMDLSNLENAEASESRSIANSFTEALADFFGYKKMEPKKNLEEDENYIPSSKEEAVIMKKAMLLDSFNSESIKASSGKMMASLKKTLSKKASSGISLSSSSASLNSSSLSVKASSSSSQEAVTAVTNRNGSYQRLKELRLQGCDPIVLDLSGEGISLTEAGKGGKFDINADGVMDSTGWVTGNTAMLVYDKNGNNVIDNGSELFGDQNGAKDGFAELAKYDKNGDGKIDKKDSIYKNLKLYRDLNGDGLMSDNEFNTLEEMGIKSLNLNATVVDENVNGNSIVLNGSFEREDGSNGTMADVIFGYKDL